jgi:hypothetical protein
LSLLSVIPDVWLPDGSVLRGADALGVQQPRFWTAPPRHRAKNPECAACSDPGYAGGCGNYQSADMLDWSAGFGYDLDDWQRWWLAELTGTKPDGRWASFENYLVMSRQNGKNVCLEVRELAGLFLFGESMIIHTAHEFLRPPPSISGASATPSPGTTSCAAGSKPSLRPTATRRSSCAPPRP